MELSRTQKIAADSAGSGENIFITGSGGVGKSALLKHMLRNQFQDKYVEVTATTGVAALHIGGTTLHSFLGVKAGDDFSLHARLEQACRNKKAKKRMRRADVLVVDEISMCDASFLNLADFVLRNIREDERPFGGLQVILLGDFLQLPPPTQPYKMAYDAQSWRLAGFKIYALKEVFRQSDEELIHHLNKVRHGRVDNDTVSYFRQYVRPRDESVDMTELYPLNRDVNRRNEEELSKIRSPLRVYHAEDVGAPIGVSFLEKNCQAPTELKLKEGAFVMLLKNMPDHGLVNGSSGRVTRLGRDYVRVAFLDQYGDEQLVKLKPETWDYIQDGKSIATRVQIPLRLAYAQTIHKSQGQTLQTAYIDLRKVFAEGHVYTGLSRVTSAEGLYLSGFNRDSVKTCSRTVQLYDLVAKRDSGLRLSDSSATLPVFNI